MTSTKSRPARRQQVYIDVAPAIPLPVSSPPAYTYHLPSSATLAGALYTRVSIPFGKRQIQGVIVSIRRGGVPYATKEATIDSPLQLSVRQVAFAQWIAQTMHGGMGFTLRLFYPAGKGQPTRLSERPNADLLVGVTFPPATNTKGAIRAFVDADPDERLKALATRAREVLTERNQMLVVVPERWLVTRTAEALRTLLPHYRLATVDASLPGSAHSAVWHQVQSGEVQIIVGTQKALFLPYRDLGLVAVEEEFYSTHKLWDQYPRLHNVRAVQQLAAIHAAELAYVTSAPSLRLVHEVAKGAVALERNKPVVPRAQIIRWMPEDLTMRRLLPDELLKHMTQWIRGRETIVVLHNARGSWQTMICRHCHRAIRCPHCQVALTVHSAKKNQLVCHHDNYIQALPVECPYCHKGKLVKIGAGTEKIFDTLQQLFPNTTITRLDADTESVTLATFSPTKQAHIIIGTSAIFTTLAGVRVDRAVFYAPERSLLYPDFRSTERTYALIVRLQQLLPPRRRVLLATRRVPATELLTQPPQKIFTTLLAERARLGYPPVTDMVLLTIKSKTDATATQRARRVREMLEADVRSKKITIRGPFAGFIKQRRGYHERHVLLTGELATLRDLYEHLPVDVVDVDPERIL